MSIPQSLLLELNLNFQLLNTRLTCVGLVFILWVRLEMTLLNPSAIVSLQGEQLQFSEGGFTSQRRGKKARPVTEGVWVLEFRHRNWLSG